ncbi:MAG: SpoIVB peptidase [Eubacterium sp.]|nr:SpoIVB peptidase [Eubacterium sp.]
MRKFIRIGDAVLAAVCAVILAFVAIGNALLPDTLIRYENDGDQLTAFYSCTATSTQSVDYQKGASSEETLRFLHTVPVKQVKVTSKQTGTVYVSGEVFGIKLYTDGVIVVGTQSVDLGGGETANPAADAGIQVGDILVAIDDRPVYSAGEVTDILNENNGLSYSVRLKRDGRYKTFELTPAYSPREGSYKAGLWVRDSTAGIGTVTFYNAENGTFASLGHPINDVDTNELMPLLEGEAVSAEVTNVQRAGTGSTGSLWCDFKSDTKGTLTENTDCGLYGAYQSLPATAEPVPVASRQEVKKGGAQILSTVEGTEPQLYDIEITKISYNKEGEQKDIVFKVTDPALLAKTGGIVQGMSGSPILQNGKLVGAITHVIVNHPEKGYAIFAQTMYEKSRTLG